MTRDDVIKALAVTAELYGREISDAAAEMMVEDLAVYPPDAVVQALARCRKEVPRFPTIADIVARIDDGRPGPEEAWALVPQGEDDSTVWTDEIRQAYQAVATLRGDRIACRKAFIEKYTKILAEVRAVGKPVTWIPNLGHDPRGRQDALLTAVEKRRITAEHAASLEPAVLPAPDRKLLGGPSWEPSSQEIRGGVNQVMDKILVGAPARVKGMVRRLRLESQPSNEEDVEKRRELLRRQAEMLKKSEEGK